MSTSQKPRPKNLDSVDAFTKALQYGEVRVGSRLHVRSFTQQSDDFFLVGPLFGDYHGGIVVRYGKTELDLPWGDIHELWLVSLKVAE